MVEYFWSCELGKFVDKTTGIENCLFPDGRRMCQFCGDQREWNETLIEVIWDVSNSLIRRGELDREVIRRLILVVDRKIAGIMRSSVICGQRAGEGVMLVPDERYDKCDEIHFVDPMTAEIHAIVRVLDLTS